jgi:hypothetical protein
VLSEEVIKELISMPCFISNCNRLAYMLHVSQKDASQQLLIELMFHRLKLWSNEDVTMAIAKESPSLQWKIKYAAKDYYRRVNKDAARELTKSQMLAGTEPHMSSQAETLEALKLLQEMFKNKATRTWAESVLRVGQRETMVRFNQTPRQFNSKLTKLCKYCHQHRHQQPKHFNSHAKELELLKEYITLVDDAASDEQVGQWVYEHKESPSLNQIVDNPLIKFQAKVLKGFVNSGVDRYTFNELMHARYIKLEQEKLKEKDIDE